MLWIEPKQSVDNCSITKLLNSNQPNIRSAVKEPWSSGYGRRLAFERLWVRIPVPDTGWTLFTLYCCKNCNVCLKRQKINQKEAWRLSILKKTKVRTGPRPAARFQPDVHPRSKLTKCPEQEQQLK